MAGTSYATRRVTKPPNWHGLVTWDMFFNNMTTGLYLVAALGEVAAPAVFGTVARVAYPVALVFLLADLLCLVIDLGDPLRFHHMLRVFKPSSPMSLGTWCLTVYSLPLTWIVALDLLSALHLLPNGVGMLGWLRWLAVLAGLPPALGSAVYKGVLLSTSSQPGWKDARWLGGYLTNAAITLGCAELLLLAALLGEARAAAVLRPALGLLLVLNLIPLGLLIGEIRPVFQDVEAPARRIVPGALALGLGFLIPLALLLAGGWVTAVGSAVSILLGNWWIRSLIVKLPQNHE
jgi:Ni/Fe-hydrogenase subunit HybB-like protein